MTPPRTPQTAAGPSACATREPQFTSAPDTIACGPRRIRSGPDTIAVRSPPGPTRPATHDEAPATRNGDRGLEAAHAAYRDRLRRSRTQLLTSDRRTYCRMPPLR